MPAPYPQHPLNADEREPSDASKASVATPPNLALCRPRCKPSKASSTALPPSLPWAASVQREPTAIATPPSSPWAASVQCEPTHQRPEPDVSRAKRAERSKPSEATRAKQPERSKPSEASRAKQAERSEPRDASAPAPPPLCLVSRARSVSLRVSGLTLTRAEQSEPSDASQE